MKPVAIITFMFLSCISFAQKGTVIPVKWVSTLPGDFSFIKKWDYRTTVFKNEKGQLVCDGLCDPRLYQMRDSSGNIFPDSLQTYYSLLDTTHYFHSIECSSNCYEFDDCNHINVVKGAADTVFAFSETGIATHCSLQLTITKKNCGAVIDLNSITPDGSAIFECKYGSVSIDRKLWEKGILKAVFDFSFYPNNADDKENIFWRGKIYSRIEENPSK